ncbi:MAG: hypothetical protein MUE81_21225 [Thermoflexibacter sp.]|nr:hypothetical protein [Thermoflexibacter sp.]
MVQIYAPFTHIQIKSEKSFQHTVLAHLLLPNHTSQYSKIKRAKTPPKKKIRPSHYFLFFLLKP